MNRNPAPDSEILALCDADSVAVAVERIWGDPLLARGVIQAVEAWQGDRGRYLSLADERRSPKSLHAAWASSLARARADAILTTAGRLRRAPALDHRLQGPAHLPEALAAWRRERLHKSEPPVTLVFTAGDAPDLEHPVFHHWTRSVVYTSRRSGWHLESRAADRGVEVVGVDSPTLSGAVDFLRHAFGAATIAIEAESTAATELYADPPVVDEVMLSVCRALSVPADALPADAPGTPFLSAERLARSFPASSKPHEVISEDSEWSLFRFRR